jgi:hypothetical protein
MMNGYLRGKVITFYRLADCSFVFLDRDKKTKAIPPRMMPLVKRICSERGSWSTMLPSSKAMAGTESWLAAA